MPLGVVGTFLLIEGPLGRLLRQRPSPLVDRLRKSHAALPLLTSARDSLSNDLFRRTRNCFAHWSFTWEATPQGDRIHIIDPVKLAVEADLDLVEVEAMHFLSASIVAAVEAELLRTRLASKDGRR